MREKGNRMRMIERYMVCKRDRHGHTLPVETFVLRADAERLAQALLQQYPDDEYTILPVYRTED